MTHRLAGLDLALALATMATMATMAWPGAAIAQAAGGSATPRTQPAEPTTRAPGLSAKQTLLG
jgi:hypothetical protein